MSYQPLFKCNNVVLCKIGQTKAVVDNRQILLHGGELLFCKPLQSLCINGLKGFEVAAIAFNRTFYRLPDDGKEQSFFDCDTITPKRLNLNQEIKLDFHEYMKNSNPVWEWIVNQSKY